ncbi:MAG: hypothetical protein IJU23_09680 [Proteobacteria bacterium]|nr:hypothetical protein [Pseudomonadota bacterium]
MKKELCATGIILASILCISGCEDSNELYVDPIIDPTPVDGCKTNTNICASGVIYKCIDNSYIEESVCKSHACLNGSECKVESHDPTNPPVVPDPKCEDSEPSCKDGKIQSCQDGNLITIDCESGVCLDDKSCKVACTTDVCHEGSLEKCEGGFLSAPTACDTGACFDDKSCKVACTTDICHEGSLEKCEGGFLSAPVACDTGACFDDKSCKVACTTDVCRDGNLQKCEGGFLGVPVACDTSACFDDKSCKVACTTDVCVDGNLQKCEGGFLSAPTACDTGACKDETSCAPQCTASVCQDGTFTKCVNGAASDPVKCLSGKCSGNACVNTEDFESGKYEGSSKKKIKAHGKGSDDGYEGEFYANATYTSKAVKIDGTSLKWSASYSNVAGSSTWPWNGRGVTSKGLVILRYDNPSILSATLPNGVGSISLQAHPFYTCSKNKARVLIYINGKNCNSDASYKTDSKDTYAKYKCSNVNTPGPVNLEIKYDGYYSTIIDDITWTDYFE